MIFYTEGCEVCAAQKAAAQALLRGDVAPEQAGVVGKDSHVDSRDINVFMVNVDKIMSSDPALATRLMDSFDLSTLPYILITDSKGVVLSRYVSLL